MLHPSLAGQWQPLTFGMKFFRVGPIECAISWLLFLCLFPLLLIWYFIAFCMLICCGKSRALALGWQYYTLLSVGTPLRHFYLAQLLLRPQFVFVCMLTYPPVADSWYTLSTNLGGNYLWGDCLRLTDYDSVRAMLEDPARERSLVVDAFVGEVGKLLTPVLPLFYSTGSTWHAGWRRVFLSRITHRAPVVEALTGDGLRQLALPIVSEWLDEATPFKLVDGGLPLEMPHRPIFKILLRLLLDVPPESLPAELLAAVDRHADNNGATQCILPAWVNWTFPRFGTKNTLPARRALASFLFTGCNAAKPESLLGLALDWAGMAKEAGLDGSGDSSGLMIESVVDPLLLAALAGTKLAVMFCLYSIEGWRWSEEHQVPAKEEMQLLYRKDPEAWILEVLRLCAPVAGTHKVLPESMRLPFLRGSRDFPAGTIVTASIPDAHVDPSAFEDPMAFRPGRCPKDRYLIWNGPFGGAAPRHCPGESIALKLCEVFTTAYLDRQVDSQA